MSKSAPMRLPGTSPAAPSEALNEWSKAPAQKAVESLQTPVEPEALAPAPAHTAPSAPAAPVARKMPWDGISPTENSPLNVAVPRALHAKLKFAAAMQDEKLRDFVIRLLEKEVDATLKDLGYIE